MESIACPSSSFCVTVGEAGQLATFNGSEWSKPRTVDANRTLDSVSCVSQAFCVAVDQSGYTVTLTEEAADATAPRATSGGLPLSAVSCPSPSFCVAASTSGAVLTFDGHSWAKPVGIEGALDGGLVSVSCPSLSFCVAKDSAGNVIVGEARAPAVTKLAPTKGAAGGGTVIKITGTGLDGATSVHFGGSAAVSFTINSSTSITAMAPPGAVGPVDVTVTGPDGTSAATIADRFTYLPTVTAVSPGSGSSAGGNTVTVSGSGFAIGATGTVFKFASTKAASVNCPSSVECTVVAPPHAAGSVDVRGTVGTLTTAKTAADVYRYE
jgi:hypothetical protein